MELIKKNTHEFKAKTIVTQVLEPFQRTGKISARNPLLAAFGNKSTDRKAYLNAGFADENIYIISCSSGNIVKAASQRSMHIESETEQLTRGINQDDDNQKHSRLSPLGKFDFSKIISNCSESNSSVKRRSMARNSSLSSNDSFQFSPDSLNRDMKLEYIGYDDPHFDTTDSQPI